MTKAEIIALAERVERAEGLDRRLDCLIENALGLAKFQRDPRVGYGDADYNRVSPKPYTASLDAAMSLVPEDWHLSLSMGRINIVTLTEDSDDPVAPARVFEASASTPALALTSASLRAIAEEMD